VTAWPSPILAEDDLVLRTMTVADAPAMAAVCGAGETGCWSERTPPYDPAEAALILLGWEEGRRTGERLALAVVAAHAAAAVTGPYAAFLGSVVILAGSADRPHEVVDPAAVELACWIRPEARGRGVATRAVTMTASWAASSLGATLVWLECDPQNTASRRVGEKAGFAFGGIRAGHCMRAGKPADCAIYESRA
jgi:RimJ/RimL family protein N-acetyltransferase